MVKVEEEDGVVGEEARGDVNWFEPQSFPCKSTLFHDSFKG